MSYLDDPRVYFAAERTLLAWQRTAIALIGLGFVIERFGLFIRMIGPPQAHTGCSGSPTEAFAAVFMRIAPLAAIALGLATRLVASG